MRISAGVARGVTLTVPAGARPASERTRAGVLSSLAAFVEGARVLDLYCGSGAWGLEALSRGAESGVFVDKDRAAVEAVKANAKKAKLSQVVVRRADVLTYLLTHHRTAPKATLAFVDPPYASEEVGVRLLDALRRRVEVDGLAVIETSSRRDLNVGAKGWLLHDDRRYGDTRILVYRKESK